MTPTLKDDFIAFFERLTYASPAHKKATEKAIAAMKKSDISNTDRDKAACANILFRFCAGQFGGVKPTLTNDDWKRIKALEKKHYTSDHQLNTRHKPR